MKRYFLTSIFVALTVAEQPEARRPTSYPSRSLQWGKLNFLHTTDTHGWLSGHLQEPQYSADWGDYISFTKRMREKADSLGVDLLVVDTGDRINGSGLYAASNPKGQYTYDLFNQQEFDILNSGNHELYDSESVVSEVSKTIPSANGNYIASNLDIIDPKTGKQVPMARRYRVFSTKNQEIKIAAFGFIYEFDRNANNSVVQRVEDAVKEHWFQKAIREDVDIFVVATHAPLNSLEHKTIHRAIRSQNKKTPIQFFGAHTHVRDFKKYDSRSYGIQSGSHMETVGWMSIDWEKNTTNPRAIDNISFRRRYIDANVNGYQYHSGLNTSTFPTDHGRNVSALIHKARKTMDLDFTFGCVPRDLFFKAPYPSHQSILSWLDKEVFPEAVIKSDRVKASRMILLNSYFVRFDIFKGAYTRDSAYAATPLNDHFDYIKNVPYKSAKDVIELLYKDDPFNPYKGSKNSGASRTQISDNCDSEEKTSLTAPRKQLRSRGYVTLDDGGCDGDDVLHTPVMSSSVPQFVYSEVKVPAEKDPEVVDLIFSSFLQPYILSSVNKVGQNYTSADVERYTESTIRDLINGWVQKKWPCRDSK
ncbi:Uncharacterized protein K3495_g6575 [Podosphaera aphanis]|nr:Uncharacterized protein K3495_g6575 [Podosphaera aphanis]